jgi:hypothetical protein
MKTQRRHELQQNELADWLSKTIEGMKPYQNLVLAGMVLVLVLILGYAWYSHAAAAETTAAWDELNRGLTGRPTQESFDSLTTVIDKYRTSSAFPVAAVLSGDYFLQSGCDGVFVDKSQANPILTRAIERYELDRQGQGPSPFSERAAFGLARAHEAKACLEDLEKAARYYKEVIEKWPHGAYAAMAKHRLEDLDRPEIKRMYDDFRKWEPKPAPVAREPGSDRPPFDMNALPKDRPGPQPGASPSFDFEHKLGERGAAQKKPGSVFGDLGVTEKEPSKASEKESPKTDEKQMPKTGEKATETPKGKK